MKHILFFIILIAPLVSTTADTLLRMGENNHCIKTVISTFPPEQHCQQMDDRQKSKLARRMAQCLLIQMGKSMDSECLKDDLNGCEISGEAWSTFSTFFAHIDNLCHFYWEILHHERAEKLIVSLSESSLHAQQILQQNAQQTSKILSLQQSLSESMQQSIYNQQQMSALIHNSSGRLANLTSNMQNFVKKIHDDIDENYGSLRNVLATINHGITQLLSIQSFMAAQICSIQGMLYFLCLFFAIMLASSLTTPHTRTNCLITFGINIIMEIVLNNYVEWLIGVKALRCLFIVIELIILATSVKQKPSFEKEIRNQLNTPRLERLFHKVIDRQKVVWMEKGGLCSSHYVDTTEEISAQ